MAIIGVDYNIPATIFVNTETGEVERQALFVSLQNKTGEYRDNDGNPIGLSDQNPTEINKATHIADGEPDGEGFAPDFPGWDWR